MVWRRRVTATRALFFLTAAFFFLLRSSAFPQRASTTAMSSFKPKAVAASSAAPRPIAQPKPMSSRLLTMKVRPPSPFPPSHSIIWNSQVHVLTCVQFMQRAAAASPARASNPEMAAVKAAAEAEAAAREAALLAHERLGGDSETRWELAYVRPVAQLGAGASMVSVGYAQLDADAGEYDDVDTGNRNNSGAVPTKMPGDEASDSESGSGGGRMVFGGFKTRAQREREQQQGAKAGPVSVSSDDEDDYDSGASDDSDAAAARKREKKREKERKKARKADVTPAFISSAGRDMGNDSKTCRSCGRRGHMASGCPKTECYACGARGHMASACLNARGTKRKDKMGGDVLGLDVTAGKKSRRPR